MNEITCIGCNGTFKYMGNFNNHIEKKKCSYEYIHILPNMYIKNPTEINNKFNEEFNKIINDENKGNKYGCEHCGMLLKSINYMYQHRKKFCKVHLANMEKEEKKKYSSPKFDKNDPDVIAIRSYKDIDQNKIDELFDVQAEIKPVIESDNKKDKEIQKDINIIINNHDNDYMDDDIDELIDELTEMDNKNNFNSKNEREQKKNIIIEEKTEAEIDEELERIIQGKYIKQIKKSKKEIEYEEVRKTFLDIIAVSTKRYILVRLIEQFFGISIISKNTLDTKPKYRKQKIPANIRNTVWDTYIGEEFKNGQCFCCGCNISFSIFECGHIIPESKKGKRTVTNLRPICGLCNRSIGTDQMDEFMEEHGYKKCENWDGI